MKRNRVLTSMLALGLLVQMVVASGARAEEPNRAADVSAGAASAIATLFALPMRLAACVATVVIGGTAYGLTMGTSELIRDELAAGTRSTCGGKYYITPQEIKEFARQSDRRM